MSSTSTRLKKPAAELSQLALAAPWEAFLLPVSAFPVPEAECALLRPLLSQFTAIAMQRWQLSQEVFIQLEQFQNQDARNMYVRRAPEWMPEMGLGVWPDRDPPASWTREEFEEAALENKSPRPLIYSVFHITGSGRAKVQAHDQMLPFGSLLEYLSPGGAQPVFARGEAALLPAIQDPSYTCFPFYVPLIEMKTLASATASRLAAWIGDSIYIRESFEDRGILLASSLPLSSVFSELGGQRSDGSLLWRVPA